MIRLIAFYNVDMVNSRNVHALGIQDVFERSDHYGIGLIARPSDIEDCAIHLAKRRADTYYFVIVAYEVEHCLAVY